jgi:hypothetical protein
LDFQGVQQRRIEISLFFQGLTGTQRGSQVTRSGDHDEVIARNGDRMGHDRSLVISSEDAVEYQHRWTIPKF